MQRDGGPGGAGGAGNPTGGSFTGPAQALELAGDFCYSYSGDVTVANNTLTPMNTFTTGNFLTELLIEIHGSFAGIGQSQFRLQVTLNEAVILNTIWAATLDSSIFDFPTRLIIPAYTEVEVSLLQAEGNPQNLQTTLTGKIFRG